MSELLIQSLKANLDPALVTKLESDDDAAKEAQAYLNEILINEQLLSTEIFASTTSESQGRTLTEEIAELDSHQRQVDLKLADLTNANQDLIINVSQDLKAISSKMDNRFDSEINSLLYTLRDLNYKWDSPGRARAADKLSCESAVLFNIDSILDILELPTLCRLCILQGNYQEALEISVLVKTYMIKFPNLATFCHIEEKVKAELRIMVKGLIKLLNTNLKQSNILKIFQILNRPDLLSMATGPEFGSNYTSSASGGLRSKSLKLIYLNSRFKFITNELASLRPLLKLKKITYLKRCIEIYREHLFNSFSIYHAIFQSFNVESNEKEDTFLAYSFVKNLVDILILELREHFPQSESTDSADDSELKTQKDGVILQLIYLCKSLEKSGLNFESMLTWNLCYCAPVIISEEDWTRNSAKVKKFRS